MKLKKLLLICFFSISISTANLFAFAIGVQGGYSVGDLGFGIGAVTFKIDALEDWNFAVNAGVGKYYVGVGLVADYWFFNKQIVGPLHWFWGIGPYANVSIWSSGHDDGAGLGLAVGGHMPVGLNLWFIDERLEIFLQAAGKVGVSIDFRDAPTHYLWVDWSVPFDLGVRWHFR